MEMWTLYYFLYIDHMDTVVLPVVGGGGSGQAAPQVKNPCRDHLKFRDISLLYTCMYAVYTKSYKPREPTWLP